MKKQRYKQKIVTLREKKLADGRVSLYLDIYNNGKRQYEFLKLYAIEKPITPEDRTHNTELLQLAEQIRMSRESEVKHSEYGIVSPQKKKLDFLIYYDAYLSSYTKFDKRMVKGSLTYFKKFLKDELKKTIIYPAEITESVVVKYRDYLLSHFKGQTPNSYFARFKKVLKQAYRESYFVRNPAEMVNCSNQENITKAILSFDEIQSIAKTECGNPEVKRAFLFCLNTGLRFCDVKDLKWAEIDGDRLIKNQQKTKKDAFIYLNNNALKLLGKKSDPNTLVFKLPSIDSSIRTVKTWAKRAGIDKNVTWHSARHSFAVNLLTQRTDIKTVGNLLGHSGLKHTEKYLHVVDELKKTAVNNLPDINIP